MNKTFVTILILVIVVFGGYFLFRSPKAQAPIAATSNTKTSEVANTNSPAQVVVTYTDAGYSPSTITVKVGTKVIWANDSSKDMWTASAMHPSHTAYSGTSVQQHCPDTAGTAFDACEGVAPGKTWSFVFNKKGEWGYHDHLNPSKFGKVIVQ